MKHSKETRKKKSTTPNNVNKNSSATSKQLSRSSGSKSQANLEEETCKVAFDVNEDDKVVSAEENRNTECIIDNDDQLPATQPVDDRVLKDVVVYVEVRSTYDNRSKAICRELVQLGAVVAKTFTDDVTHVVLKEGSKRTINKATKKGIHLVSVLWVDSCKQNQQHVSERLYPAMLPDQKGTPLFIAKLKKAKSMQPRDFADDLASSAKKKKKQKSTESTPYNSPCLGAILVEDTQPRGSPLPTRTSDIHTPIRLTIPDTPPSMRAKMMELNRQFKDIDGESTDEIQFDKPEFDEPLQRRLFTGLKGCDFKNAEASDGEKRVSFCVASPLVTSKRETKRRVSSRRKSVASVCFKDNVENFQKEVSRNSLPEVTKMEKKGNKKPVQRRKSMAAVNFTTVDLHVPADEGVMTRRNNTKRRSVQPKPTSSDLEVEEPTRWSKKSLEKIEIFLESDRTANGDSSKPEDTEISGVQCSNDTSSGSVPGRVSEEVNCSNNTVDEYNLNTFTKTNNRRQSSKIAAKNFEKLLYDGKVNVCTSMDSSSTKIQTVANETSVKILKPKKRLLATSDMEAHSFLIAPTMCSEKVFGKILENTPDRTSTQVRRGAKVQGQKRKKHSFNDSADTPKRLKKEGRNESTASVSADSKVLTGENKSSSQHANTDHDIRNVLENESMLGSSMSVVFSESSCSNPFGIAPPRQSIDEFNLRTKFNNKKMRKKKKALSDSAVSSLNTESDTSSSGEEVRVNRMRRHPSFTKTSPIRPSLVMTSLHSHEQDIVISVVKKLKGFSITDHVNDSTTHVVCGGPRRTLNILHAITRGCWVLRKEWVMESLEACRWLPEESYEVTDWFPSAQVTRFRRQTSQENAPQLLFDSIGVFFITPKAVPPRHHLMELIQRCAGKVTSSSSKADIYVGSDFLPEKTSVNPLWILDCVTQNCLLPMDSYLLGRPKRDSSPEY